MFSDFLVPIVAKPQEVRMKSSNQKMWNLIKKIFPILEYKPDSVQSTAVEESEFLEVVATLRSLDLGVTIQDMIVERVLKSLRQEIVPNFWLYFKRSQGNGFIEFFNSVKYLYDKFVELDVTMTKLEMLRHRCEIQNPIHGETCAHSALKLLCRASLLAQLPTDYQTVVMAFYETALKIDDPNDSTSGQCIICQQGSGECDCSNLFYETNR